MQAQTLNAHGTAAVNAATAVGPASGPKSHRRNTAIDVLRGYCIVMMVTSHVATASYVNGAVHGLRFVSGAEGFVFLSGLVLGLVYRRRMDAAPALDAYRAIWRRARTIWLVHVIAVLSAIVLNTAFFHYSDIPKLGSLPFGTLLWRTAILQLQPGHMLNILPMYVFLLGLAPGVLEMMRRGRTAWLLLASGLVFLNCQYHPGAGRWADAVSGGEAFPVLAWQVLFIPGMAIGYNYSTLRDRVVSPHRGRLMWGLACATAAIALVVCVQTTSFQFYDHAAWDLFLWERHPLRFGRVLYFLLSVGAAYFVVQAWLRSRRLPQAPLAVLETLGRNSLYAFIVHLMLALCLGAVVVPPDRWLLSELMAVGAVGMVYVLSRYQVGRKWIPN